MINRTLVNFVCVLLTMAATAYANGKANFIVIMTDDMGYSDLSCYGNDRYKTPHIDKLAAGGMKFTDFHSNGAVCSPTRAALMTGRYQRRAGIPGVVFAAENRPEHLHGLQVIENTLAESMKEAGYVTAMYGKWHLGYFPKYNPVRHGFDQFRGYVSGNVDFFSHVDQAGNFDWWIGDKKQQEEGYTTYLITKHALSFIETNKDKPFCLYLPHEAPHYPYQGPNDKAERKAGSKFNTIGARKDKDVAYKEMVQAVDKGVGQIMELLRKHDLEKNTLVLFFSDNGATKLGNNGPLRGTKGQVWEGGHRVPCIAHWPGKVASGSRTDQLALTMDIMPTLIELAESNAPTDRPLDGISLAPVLLDGKSIGKRKAFWEHGNGYAMRDGEWKLVVGARGFKGKGLFDLSKDPGEKENLAKQEPQRLKAMSAALEAWKKDVAKGATPQPTKETAK